MPFIEDLDIFLREDEFAHTCELRLASGEVRQRRGIFDEPFLDADLGEYRLETSQPRLLGKEVDFKGIRRGDTVVITGRVFNIMSSPQVDGTGMATLRLSPADDNGGR